MTRCTADSFPGMGLADRMTVSPRATLTSLCSPDAMRVNADRGSPCDPVHTTTVRSGGTRSSSSMSTIVPSRTLRCPSAWPTSTLLTMERPTKATRRSLASAASHACWMRCRFDAKHATMIRLWAPANISRRASPTTDSEGVRPGRSAFVESDSSRSIPFLPAAANPSRSVLRPERERHRVGDRVRDGQKAAVEGADAPLRRSAYLYELRIHAEFVQTLACHPEGQRGS